MLAVTYWLHSNSYPFCGTSDLEYASALISLPYLLKNQNLSIKVTHFFNFVLNEAPILKYTIVLLLFVFSCHFVHTQSCKFFFFRKSVDVSKDKVCNDLLLNDLQFIKKKLEEVHPALYLYCSKESFDSAYNATLLALNKPHTIYEFSLLVSDWLSLLHDSHTFLPPKNLVQYKSKGRYTYPFRLCAIDNKLFVSESWRNRLPKGSELIAFDNVSIPKTMEKSLRMSPIEGDVFQAQKEFSISQLGTILNVSSPTIKKTVKYLLPGKDTVTAIISPPLFWRSKSGNKLNASKKDLSLTIQDSTAHLIIQTFSPKSYKKFKIKLTRIFDEINTKHIKHLIIDLRDNLGGYVALEEYLMLLIAKNTPNFKAAYIYKRSAHDRFSTLSIQQRWQFKQLAKRPYSSDALRKELAFFYSPYGTVDTILITTQLKNKTIDSYSNKCTLLTNGLSMSASANFAAWFRTVDRGQIVGTPCMGTLSGTFANSTVIFLPNTMLSVSISTLKITPAHLSEISLSPIVPDVIITPTQTQIIKGIDPCIDFLLNN
jgi:C-terminal processing protease CtpA/Prc